MRKYLLPILIFNALPSFSSEAHSVPNLTELPQTQVNLGTNFLNLKILASPNTALIFKNPQTGEVRYPQDSWAWQVLKKNGYFYLGTDRLQGYALHADQNEKTCRLVDIKGAPNKLIAHATTEMIYKVNLDCNCNSPAQPFNPDDTSTYNYALSRPHVDSHGKLHAHTLFFVKTSPNHFNVFVLVDGIQVAQGFLEFGTSGALIMASGLDAISVSSDEAKQYFKLNFVDSTEFSAPFQVFYTANDGYSAGGLVSETVDKHGCLTAIYDNGLVKSDYKIAIIHTP